ncbi:MAG: hypothetical protein Kow0059_17720 [Candidatus Sumerlaeia bacterium]
MSDLFALDRVFQTYLRKHLGRRLKFDPQHCRVIVPQEGVQSNIRLVEFAEGGGVAVRIFQRRDRAIAEQLYHADDLLTQHKVPAPALVDYYESNDRHQLIMLAEERVEGVPAGQVTFDDGKVESLAMTFRRLHRVQSAEWGPPAARREKGFAAEQMRKASHRLSAVKRRGGALVKKQEWKKAAEFMKAWKALLESVKVFRLIHDKINAGNLIYNPAKNEFALIDLVTLQFGHPHKDLIPLYHEVLEENPEHVERFRTLYWADYSESERQQALTIEPFFHAYYHLAECAINLKRLSKWTAKRGLADSAYIEKFARHWSQLLQIVEN